MRRRSAIARLGAVVLVAALSMAMPSAAAHAGPAGGPADVGHLYQPTDAALLPDGRLLVLEKQGILKLFPTFRDQLPVRLLDLTNEVWSFRDFGAMALAVSPTFATDRTIYLLYDRDALPFRGSVAPEWGSPAVNDDVCPGDIDPGCTIGARLISMQVTADNRVENIRTVLESGPTGGWCFQFDGHGVDDLAFDSAGALLVSAGDGARSDAGDTGATERTTGCGAYPGDERATEGGALRALDALTPSAYTSFNGTILRIDPHTGAAWPDNVLVGGPEASDDRVVAIGLRNPFRMSLDAATGTVYVGDVGANRAEEIDVVDVGRFSLSVQNFQWPCREGTQPSQSAVIAASPLCSATDAVPNAVGQAALTYGELPSAWCGPGGLATIGGSVFRQSDGAAWYVFGDWVGGCMLAVPIAADRVMDMSRAQLVEKGTAPARVANVDGMMLVVDIARGAVRLTDVKLFRPPVTNRIGQWIGRTIAVLVLIGLLTVLVVRRRAAHMRRSREPVLKSELADADTDDRGTLADIASIVSTGQGAADG